MPQIRALWRRAFIWRMTLYSFVVLAALTLIFPASWMQPYWSWGSGAQQKLPQTAAQDPGAPPAQSAHKFTGLPIIAGEVPFAGHLFPLPAGNWRPIIASNGGIQGTQEILFLIRLDENIVTGVIILAADTRPLSLSALQGQFSLCDAPGNYIGHTSSSLSKEGAKECWLLAPSRSLSGIDGQDFPEVLSNALNQFSLPTPSLFIQAHWVYAAPATPGTWYPTIFTMFLAPNEPGTLRLIAPKFDWNVSNFARQTETKRFVDKTANWFENWIAVMRDALSNNKQGVAKFRDGADRDPAYPRD